MKLPAGRKGACL